MSDSDLNTLEALTEAQFRAVQAELEPILVEERRLRRSLADLDEKTHKNATLPISDLTDLQRLAGDMAWRRWAAQSRTELQMRLARVLARKANKMAVVRQAFGRAEAVAMMQKQRAATLASKRDKAQLEEIQALACLMTTPES
jgi:septal ring factor EnvC (AmiA/AmiB activator)